MHAIYLVVNFEFKLISDPSPASRNASLIYAFIIQPVSRVHLQLNQGSIVVTCACSAFALYFQQVQIEPLKLNP